MQKTILSVVALSMATAVPMATPTAASANGAATVAALCQEFAETFGASVGECVSASRTRAQGFCKYAEENLPGFYAYYGFRNRGDCVSWIRANQNQDDNGNN